MSDLGYDRGADGPNIYLYQLESGVLERITSDFPSPHKPFWLNNHTIVYGQAATEISLLDTQSGEAQIAQTFPERIR